MGPYRNANSYGRWQQRVSYHDSFKSCRRRRLFVVHFIHIRSPDVQVQTIFTDRVLGVPHVRADKVSVGLVYRLHACVANVVCLIRVCSARALNGPHTLNSLLAFTHTLTYFISIKLHYTDTGYGHVVQHTNGRGHNNSTTCCTTNLPHRNARTQHLDMSRCWDVANFCPLVVNLLYNKLVILYNMSHSWCPCSAVCHLRLLNVAISWLSLYEKLM